MLKLLLSAALALVVLSSIVGQRTIHGTVKDPQTGEGLIGANVVVKDTAVGTVTDFDGSYSLVVPKGFEILSFSYTGYSTVEVQLGASDVLDVALGQGKLLEEVVLIGYGTVKRVDATGSVQSVSSKDFNQGAITAPQELLAGKVPGVVIIAPDGAPGSGATIRIRGESSLSASNDPLIVIDGVPVDNGGISGGRNPLNVINPNDIETFTVLKDASAAAIYGNRAAAGVILITTKKGTLGKKIKIGYNGNISSGQAENQVDALYADEYRALMYSRYDSTDIDEAKILALMGDANTNWQDEIYQTAIGTDHNLYASGGIGIVPYRVSLGYTNKEGILKTDHFEKFSASVNLTPGFFNNTLQINAHFKSAFTNNQFADRGAIGNALNFDPTQAIYDTLSPYGGFTTWKLVNGSPNTLGPTNPIALLTLRDDQSNETRYLTNLSADYRFPFFSDLRANLNLAYDYAHGEGTVDVPDSIASFAFNIQSGGGVHNVYSQTKSNRLLEFYLNYKKYFGEHSVDLMAGYSWQHFEVDNSFINSDVAGTPAQTTQGADPAEYFLLSGYARLNYGFKDRYLLTLTIRRDGTSRFAPENRWGLFPAAALAIKVIENDNNSFNNLKVRIGWGATGQQEIGDYYAYLARYQIGTNNALYQFGDEFVTTLRPNGYDANIRWEETETFNLGFDFSIINRRLSGSLDLYQRNTKDLLNRIPVPAGTNLSNFVTTNVGNMENKGIEIAFTTTPILTKKVTWDFSINGAYNHNEITKLTATNDTTYQGVLTGGIAGGVGSNIQIHSVGYAPRSFYVNQQLYDENGQIIEGSFANLNGDTVINAMDRYRYKHPAPDYTIGFTSRLAIGNFDFSFAGRVSLGNYVYNNVQTDMGYLLRLYGSSGVLWNVNQSAVDLNVEDQASLTFSDHFVKEAGFMKLDHITIGYNFDNLIGDFLRLYATVQNPLVITEYDGLDPEVPNGIDRNIYPRPRTVLFGVNIEF
jgi:iron complex outermembrane receptor protein